MTKEIVNDRNYLRQLTNRNLAYAALDRSETSNPPTELELVLAERLIGLRR